MRKRKGGPLYEKNKKILHICFYTSNDRKLSEYFKKNSYILN